MKSMKIGMISLYLPSGSKIGCGYQAHYMANAMVARGHAVTMFSPCQRPGDAAYQHEQVDVGSAGRTFRFAWNLRRFNWTQFDVVHAHGDDYWLWGRDIPVHIRTMHGSCFAEAVKVPSVKEKIRMAMLGVAEVLATVVADRTVCVSKDTLRYYPWVKDVIVNGVDLREFRPQGERAPVATILFVGTYHNRKRGKLLMEEFANVVRPAIPQAQLQMVCSDAPAAPGVEVLGRVSTQQLAELYRRAWVFCLPSSYEGFGVPYIEAMASGTPIVATPNPGALEVLEDGRFGVITGPEHLGRELAALLQDESRRHHLSIAGLKRAQCFGMDSVVSAYERVWAEVSNERQQRRERAPASVAQ